MFIEHTIVRKWPPTARVLSTCCPDSLVCIYVILDLGRTWRRQDLERSSRWALSCLSGHAKKTWATRKAVKKHRGTRRGPAVAPRRNPLFSERSSFSLAVSAKMCLPSTSITGFGTPLELDRRTKCQSDAALSPKIFSFEIPTLQQKDGNYKSWAANFGDKGRRKNLLQFLVFLTLSQPLFLSYILIVSFFPLPSLSHPYPPLEVFYNFMGGNARLLSGIKVPSLVKDR